MLADVSVEFWHSFSNSAGEALDQIIDTFEAENPGITIDAQHIGNDNDIGAKLQASIPAAREPDAVIMEVTRYGLSADRGVLMDLTDYVENEPLKDDLFDFAARWACSREGITSCPSSPSCRFSTTTRPSWSRPVCPKC